MRVARSYYFIALFLAVTCLVTSCETGSFVSHGQNHKGYMDSVFKNTYTGSLDSARFFRMVDSGYRALRNPGAGDLWDKYVYQFGYYTTTLKQYATAMLYADSMLYAIKGLDAEKDYVELFAKSYFYKGDLLQDQRRFAEAFGWYYKARQTIIEKNNDPCILFEYNSRLAAATFRQQMFVDAATYYKQTIKDLDLCNNHTNRWFYETQGCLDNVGIAYVKAGMYDSADIYFTKALVFLRKNKDILPDSSDFINIASAIVYGNQAAVAIKQHRPEVAEKLLKESIRINSLPNHPNEDVAYGRIKLINLYYSQKRIAEAQVQLDKLKVASLRYPANTDLTKNFYLLRSTMADFTGDHKTAYEYLIRYHSYVDSINAIYGPVATTDMQQAMNNMNREYQMELLAKDNKRKEDYLWLTIVISTLFIALIVLIWTTYRDTRKNVVVLTELHDAVTYKNQVLLQTLTALEHSHNYNSKLIKVVAHDLRGPLGAITSIAELASDGKVPDEKYEEIMGIIYRSGNKALSLANDLLMDLQNLGTINNPEPLQMDDQLNYCVELYEHKIKEKGQKVVLETVSAVVIGDREKIWRAFSNLISNAVKFSHKTGLITIAMRKENENLVISFHDEGIGIPDHLKDRIFEPTEATTRPGTIGELSYGLGLSITRNIVLLHLGRLWFESNPQTGTTFYVSLPLASIANS